MSTLARVGAGLLAGWYVISGWTHPIGPPVVEESGLFSSTFLSFLLQQNAETLGSLGLVFLNTLVWLGYLGTVWLGMGRMGSSKREKDGMEVWRFLVFLAFPHAWLPVMAGPPRDTITLFLMGAIFLTLTSSPRSSLWVKAGAVAGSLLLGLQHAEASLVAWMGTWICCGRDPEKNPLGWWGIPAGILLGKALLAFSFLGHSDASLVSSGGMPGRVQYALDRFPWLMEILKRGGEGWAFSILGWAWGLQLLLRPLKWRWLFGAMGVAALTLDPTRVFVLITFWPFLVSSWGGWLHVPRWRRLLFGYVLIAAILPRPTFWSGVLLWATPEPWGWIRVARISHAVPDRLCPLPWWEWALSREGG